MQRFIPEDYQHCRWQLKFRWDTLIWRALGTLGNLHPVLLDCKRTAAAAEASRRIKIALDAYKAQTKKKDKVGKRRDENQVDWLQKQICWKNRSIMRTSFDTRKEFCQCCQRCCGAVVKHTDSWHDGCEFESYTCRNKNTIDEEGNGKPPHEIHYPRKKSTTLEIEYATQSVSNKEGNFNNINK